jgi:transcriptional regulator with XRE-family HTH domain
VNKLIGASRHHGRCFVATSLGRRVRELRLGRDLSIEGMAMRAGLSTTTIVDIETRGTPPSYTTLLKLCLALDVPPCELMGVEH